MDRLLIGVTLVASLLAGCFGRSAVYGSLSLGVRNSVSWEETGPGVLTCGGGLRTRVVLGGFEILDDAAADGEMADDNGHALPPGADREELISEGTPVLVEAWCLDGDGAEVGYARLESALLYSTHSNGILVTRPRAGCTCLPPTEERGEPPCIHSSILEQACPPGRGVGPTVGLAPTVLSAGPGGVPRSAGPPRASCRERARLPPVRSIGFDAPAIVP